MAEQDDLDLDAEKPAAGGKKKLILIIVGVLLLVGLSVGITLLLVGGGDTAEEGEAEQVEEALPEKPIYLPLEKITVNLSQKGSAKFLQVEMQLMSYDQKLLDAVTVHMPVIRNDMLVLLASQPVDKLASLEGKEQLRKDIVEKIHTVLKEQAELEGGLEAVYFTRFIMQ